MKELMEADMYNDDNIFYRFLKARDFNIDLSETMLKNHLEWRNKYDIKNIHKTKHPKVLMKYIPYELVGYDKEGFPVRYAAAGNTDWLGLRYCVKIEDVMKKVICNVEEDIRLCKEMSKKLGRTVDKIHCILDCDNLSLLKATDKTVIMNSILFFIMYQNNYPETLKSCYIINASMYFSLAYAAIKRCIASSVLEKIKIYYDDSYKEDLLKIIDDDVLPGFLGGTKTDPDGNVMCSTYINRGGPIPESYYMHKSKRPLSSKPGVQRMTLFRAEFREVALDVKEPGSHLEWEFETKSRDIGFGLFYRQISNGKQSNVEVIPIRRIDTEEYAETGLYMCEKAGTYTVIFDNTYSLIRSKELFYRIQIVKPGEQESAV